MTETPHLPVMVREVVEHLAKGSGAFLDGTVGAAGHTLALWEALGGKASQSEFFGVDRDDEILKIAQLRCATCPQIHLSQGVYEDWKNPAIAGKKFQGVLLDLGVSSLQFDRAERGFGFSQEAPLDMRMDTSVGETAADIIAEADEREIEEILKEYGEEPFARRIARRVVESRRQEPIRTTKDLARLVERAVPRGAWPKRIHPATRTFQGLRIRVNDELGHLDRFLATVAEHLEPGGRVAVMSYHSLEDRRVKRAFLESEKLGLLCRVTKKPLIPSEEEVAENPRARSAKLRVAERVSL